MRRRRKYEIPADYYSVVMVYTYVYTFTGPEDTFVDRYFKQYLSHSLSHFSGLVKPSYNDWSPYVGLSRGARALNTEYEKASKCSAHHRESEDELQLSEDLLIDLMSEKKASRLNPPRFSFL